MHPTDGCYKARCDDGRCDSIGGWVDVTLNLAGEQLILFDQKHLLHSSPSVVVEDCV